MMQYKGFPGLLVLAHQAIAWLAVIAVILVGCQGKLAPTNPAVQATAHPLDSDHSGMLSTPVESGETGEIALADVLQVSASGAAGSYTFAVEISSPDAGCELYADWWEVLNEEGGLLYRRILAHSHAGEQPFTRSGGPVQVQPDTVLIVRAHMHPGGYGGSALRGSLQDGFVKVDLSAGFAEDIAQSQPQPETCDF